MRCGGAQKDELRSRAQADKLIQEKRRVTSSKRLMGGREKDVAKFGHRCGGGSLPQMSLNEGGDLGLDIKELMIQTIHC